jgi:carbon monoxide dehydrogenase subunit G
MSSSTETAVATRAAVRDFAITVDIAAPPAVVWAVMRDVERWHEWTTTVTSIKRLDSGPLAVGSRLRIRQPKLPPADWTVTDIVEDRGFKSITRGPGVSVTAHHWIAPVECGSRVTLSIRFSGALGGLIARLTHRLNNDYLAIEAAGLKRRAEERARDNAMSAEEHL